ncbi:hypothetical protein AB3S75_023157 [Citrus x aurantiifolia]
MRQTFHCSIGANLGKQ